MIAKISEMSNTTAQQYGTGINQSGSGVYGTLTWPDGSKGLAQVGDSVMVKNGQDMYTGAPNGFATTTVFHQAIIRYPPAREAEAIKLFGTFLTSHRMNPVWQKAKDNFLTNLGNAEWKDSNGDNVELSAGYKFGWSRPNGSIILTNNLLFDPAVEFQQNWSRMQKRPE